MGKHLNEKLRRRFLGAEAKVVGRGGIELVSRATGVSRPTIRRGAKEVRDPRPKSKENGIREPGGGRQPLTQKDPTLVTDLKKIVEPHTRGDPESPLIWSSKSTRKSAAALQEMGHSVSGSTAGRLLHQLNFSLQANKKTFEGSKNPDRDAQFEHIFAMMERHMAAGNPVISVDAKKKELVGQFKNKGRQWRPKGQPQLVNAYDFIWMAEGRATPFGIYDVAFDEGFVNLGMSGDTATFSVESIRRWWRSMGRDRYPDPDCLLITCDCGGSNSYRIWLWKWELQLLADEIGIPILVCHYPPGTSKWNKIEHNLFNHISMNWAGGPLISFAVMKRFIESTTTTSGLTVRCRIDENIYLTGKKRKKVSEEQKEVIMLERDDFRGEWNYTFQPREQPEN